MNYAIHSSILDKKAKVCYSGFRNEYATVP